ncbi:MAG: hypothetical protein PHT59_03205 [Candidatus Omnitrophica bacterium]|nr:hypothetical protein [Candidatus Omnitrophota bacterium]
MSAARLPEPPLELLLLPLLLLLLLLPPDHDGAPPFLLLEEDCVLPAREAARIALEELNPLAPLGP